ncbi:hypothetical protein EG334_03040 [Pectobacterium versatile]|nr:hypothetical protein EG334_03040 [Pectobacterium versatile]
MSFLRKTFGGLEKSYLIRSFIFGALISIFFIYMLSQRPKGLDFSLCIIFIINMVLYPYSRFVYEMIVNFILGSNVFYINSGLMIFTKSLTICLCWVFSIFIAPLGLAYLYYHHTKKERNEE